MGCGTSSYDCDAHRYFGSAECVPMPAAWACSMDGTLSTTTGWRSVVTFLGGPTSGSYVYGANAAGTSYGPSAGDALHPVCAKMGPP